MKKTLEKIYTALFTVSVFLLIGFIAIMAPANSRAFYKSEFYKNGTLSDVKCQAEYLSDESAKAYISHLTDSQLLDLMMHSMRYCEWLENDLNITVDGEYLRVFRPDELSHMADVRGVFGGGLLIVAVAVVIIISYIIWMLLHKDDYYENCRKVPLLTLAVLGAVLLVLAVVVAIDFNTAFETFHRIFFSGNYEFTDGVMIYMIGYIFTDIVTWIIGIWASLLCVFIVAISLINKRLRKKIG